MGDDIDTLPRSEASGLAGRCRHQPRHPQPLPLPVHPCRYKAWREARALSQTFLGLFLYDVSAGHSKSVSLVRGAAVGREGEKGA